MERMMVKIPTRQPDFGFHPEQPWFVVNSATHYSVIPSQNPAISHFYSFDVAATAPTTLAVPDGCIDIVFDCDSSSPTARVCGTTLEARDAEMHHGHHYFGIRFAPGIIPDFLDVMAEEIPGQEFGFLDVVPDAKIAFEQIVKTNSLPKQMTLFNTFFTPRLVRKSSSVTTSMIQALVQNKGNLRLNQLESLTGYTSRSIQRFFRQDTGMSPKAFSRILRCQSALSSLHQQQALSVSDLAFTLGFSDQSHFLREFKTFVSKTPGEYLRDISRESFRERLRYH